MYKKYIFNFIFIFLILIFGFILFKPIYISDTIIINYGLKPFNICVEQPTIWNQIKLLFVITYILSTCIISKSISNFIFKNVKSKNKSTDCVLDYSNTINSLNLYVGLDSQSKNKVFIPEKSLYQNILITGTIGTGKTSCAIYPFTKQLIKYQNINIQKKLGMLILDVKGNFYTKVIEYSKLYNRLDDLVVISLEGNIKYNPLDKPKLKPNVLANRIKTILTLFSKNNSESYWLDKVEQILCEAIKFCRLYNYNYVTFDELHKLVTVPKYYLEKMQLLRTLFQENKFNTEDIYNLSTAIDFFEKEFNQLDPRTLNILKSEITRITGAFISDYKVSKIFCPKKNEINFHGFEDVINNGKIVVLSMNIAEYYNISKIIATYLKIDFQSEVLSRLSRNSVLRSTLFVSDEFQEYVTTTDADFFSQSREAKCINIISTQSYSSLLNTLGNNANVKVLIQSLVNKLWFRTDDLFTIEEAQKQLGKEDKLKISKTISENAKETNFNYLTNSLNSKNSNLSESINSYYYTDYIYDTKFFTQGLETFSCLSFLSDGNKISNPTKINLIPYFKEE